MKKSKKMLQACAVLASLCMVCAPAQPIFAAEATRAASAIVINEVESSAADNGPDWVEIRNTGTEDLDLSGWYLTDDKGVARYTDGETTPLPDGTVLKAGEVLVLEEYVNFTFGLGKADTATLFDADGNQVDTFSWTSHAAGTYSRMEDGTFVDQEPTKGKSNVITAEAPTPGKLVLNEINSSPDDWVEVMNIGESELNLTGYEIRDNSDDHRFRFADGTKIGAGELLLVKADTAGWIFDDNTKTYVAGQFDEAIGIGSGDLIRLYDADGKILDQHSWTEHANLHGDQSASWGRYPDGTGDFVIMPESAGTKNSVYSAEEINKEETPTGETLDVMAWPGSDQVVTSPLKFLEDSSGLDFYNGQLYAVDNGTGKYWVLDVAADGTLSFAKGFEEGVAVNFVTPSAKGPDTEGITVDGDGCIYLASERDNSNKGVNYNVILKVDPKDRSTSQNAAQQWDLTESLPSVPANLGIEAVEWVSNDDVKGLLVDENTGKTFDPANYPNAIASGVFFVALEDNGHVYAFVLNADDSVVRIADIDSKLGGAMALDYDTSEKKLWVAADNGFGNRMAVITLNGTTKPGIVHVNPAAGVDTTANNEGFAIATADYAVDGLRPVYRFNDGVKEGALTIGWLGTLKQAPDSEGLQDDGNEQSSEAAQNPGTSQNGAETAATTISSGSVPQTGDSCHPGVWISLLVLSCLGLVYVMMPDKKTQRESDRF